MFNFTPSPQLTLIDELRIQYWRLVLRLARFASRWEAYLDPLRTYFWLPIVALLTGMVVGLLLSVL
ncbi:MAG: hypothetical protein ACRDH2_02485 [Anaerolineales bacterium]